MHRRELLTAAAGAAVLAAAATADAKPGADPKPDATAALLAAIADCQRTGELCRAHCAKQLADGDKAFAHCNVAVQAMLATVAAAATVAALGSPQAKQLVTVCSAICKECEDACAEHKAHFAHGMHLECRDCMNACAACEKACAAFAA